MSACGRIVEAGADNSTEFMSVDNALGSPSASADVSVRTHTSVSLQIATPTAVSLGPISPARAISACASRAYFRASTDFNIGVWLSTLVMRRSPPRATRINGSQLGKSCGRGPTKGSSPSGRAICARRRWRTFVRETTPASTRFSSSSSTARLVIATCSAISAVDRRCPWAKISVRMISARAPVPNMARNRMATSDGLSSVVSRERPVGTYGRGDLLDGQLTWACARTVAAYPSNASRVSVSNDRNIVRRRGVETKRPYRIHQSSDSSCKRGSRSDSAAVNRISGSGSIPHAACRRDQPDTPSSAQRLQASSLSDSPTT